MDVAQIRALKPRLDNYLARFEDCFSRCDTREHLAVCDGCERYLDQFRMTIRELGALPAESLRGETRASLLTAFRDWHDR